MRPGRYCVRFLSVVAWVSLTSCLVGIPRAEAVGRVVVWANYDAAVVETGPINDFALTNFVACGGGVYVVGGGGNSDALYNGFLTPLGASFSPFVDLSYSVTTFVAHSLTAGVAHLNVER